MARSYNLQVTFNTVKKKKKGQASTTTNSTGLGEFSAGLPSPLRIAVLLTSVAFLSYFSEDFLHPFHKYTPTLHLLIVTPLSIGTGTPSQGHSSSPYLRRSQALGCCCQNQLYSSAKFPSSLSDI